MRDLKEVIGLPTALCELLIRRGHSVPAEAKRFLRPRLDTLHDPRQLPDMDRAVARLRVAVAGGETVLVHGDYDVDGMSGTALLVSALRAAGARPVGFVPHRRRDGYDLGPAGLARAEQVGAGLIVTTDCGIQAHEAVRAARDRKIDVIVTDHHRPGTRLPDALAVVNPSRADSLYPFKGLAGVGVAFKLASELFRRLDLPDARLNQHLDLVALGTVADQAPLVDENRTLVRFGLRALERTLKPGLRSLLWRARYGGPRRLNADDIAFGLAPRLNSTGRIGAAEDGLRLLLSTDPEEADQLAEQVERQNALRRDADRRLLSETVETLERTDAMSEPVIVLSGEDWHPGVLGITASRLVDRTGRPVVLVGFEGDRGRGSGRSVEGFHLFRALEACAATLERFGGHAMAAGFDIRRERLPAFRHALGEYAGGRLAPDAAVPPFRVDLELELREITTVFARGLSYFGPFGVENPAPVIRLNDVKLIEVEAMGADQSHIRGRLVDGEHGIDTIGFGLAERARTSGAEARLDVLCELEFEQNRGPGPRARLIDLRPRS